MKIALLTRGGFENPKIWSGTPKTLYTLFSSRKDLQISTADMELPRGFRGFYYHCFCSIFFFMYHAHDFLLRPFFRVIFNRIFNRIGRQDFSIQISDYYIPPFLHKYGKHAIYIDAHRPEWWDKLCQNDRRWLRNIYLKDFNKATKQSLINSDLVFTQNDWTKIGIARDFGIDPKKVINVRFGVNLESLHEEKDYSRNLLLIVLRKGFEEAKGLNLLLKALPRIREQILNTELAVVGTDVGNDVEGVRNYVNQPRETTVRLFKECTLYTMPAIAEPNGITYLEGLANKAPIVGLNRFAFPEFSGYGEWGFICKNEDPEELAAVIIDALSNKQRLKVMGERGQKFVMENYVWEKVVDNMLRLMTQEE